MQDLPYLNTRFRDFKGNWRGVGGGGGYALGLKVCMECDIPIIIGTFGSG